MSVASVLLEGAAFVLENAPIFKAIGEAVAAGAPKEAIAAAVRGVVIRTGEQDLRDEFAAADKRRAGAQGRAAYEAWNRAMGIKVPLAYESLDDDLRGAWEAAADATR